MILHVATFRWNDDVTEQQVQTLTEALHLMASRIESLRSYTAGPNLHLRPGGTDYAVAAITDDAAGLDAYLDHPEHQAVYAQHLGDMIAERSAAQLQISAGSLA